MLGKFAGGSAPAAEDGDGAVKVRMHDITNRDIAGVTALVEEERAAAGAAQHGAWKPWFPVIDYDRCTNCMQCLSFCLFGVYGVDDGEPHPGAEQRQLQNELPGLLARVPRGGDHVSEIQGGAHQRRHGERDGSASARR